MTFDLTLTSSIFKMRYESIVSSVNFFVWFRNVFDCKFLSSLLRKSFFPLHPYPLFPKSDFTDFSTIV